tara:strand:+ start:1133 stop:2122 length:990 start_codon:yes stop_codon:yes gene_type:complete
LSTQQNNNYSYVQRIIHKTVLSSKFFKKLTFNYEKSLFLDHESENKSLHVFIIGLARSGSTLILNGLHKSGVFASLTYGDMPFPLAPNFWSKLNISKQNIDETERIHSDGIMVNDTSPESFEEVFWSTFENEDEMLNFNDFIFIVRKKYKKDRYLSKNNQSIKRIHKISRYIENCMILTPFRDPLQQSLSLIRQHFRFINMQKNDQFIVDFMNLTGHREFGLTYKPFFSNSVKYDDFNDINHWLEQWYFAYNDIFQESLNNASVNLVSYEKLCNTKVTWKNILNKAEIDEYVSLNIKKPIKYEEYSNSIDKDLLKRCYKLYDDMSIKSL